MKASRRQRRALAKDNARRPADLVEVPRDQWPSQPDDLHRVWRSCDYLVQEWLDRGGVRISVCRTVVRGGRWADGLTWDELQAIKGAIGYWHRWAVECYPPDLDVVDVANMRHLWLLPEPPAFGWKRL